VDPNALKEARKSLDRRQTVDTTSTDSRGKPGLGRGEEAPRRLYDRNASSPIGHTRQTLAEVPLADPAFGTAAWTYFSAT
jgi:hypothetical protein